MPLSTLTATTTRDLAEVRRREALAAAVARLDRLAPSDWRDRVAPRRLSMWDYFDCVLGQVFGNYADGADALYGVRAIGLGLPSYRDEVASGFAAFQGGFPREAWVAYLTTARDDRDAL